METEPKDKYHGLRQRQGRNPHDRAIPDTLRQPDLRSTFKSVLKNFFFNSQAFGQVEELLSNLPFEQKSSLLKDLNVMRYISSFKILILGTNLELSILYSWS